jgi:uncharacterized protein YcbK (DUF882 family)|tara:strand:- start:519 stop:992 length:474 start_codon:yes stop_codon:yes gene_type:complete
MFTLKTKTLITKIVKTIKKSTEDKVDKMEIDRHIKYPAMKYFTYDEFSSPDLIDSGYRMDPVFLLMLERAREIAEVPFIINSGYRTIKHNKKVGGVVDSSHTKIPCRACDIKITNSRQRSTIIRSLISAGFNRIGVAKNFIHVDNDTDKSPFVIWTY